MHSRFLVTGSIKTVHLYHWVIPTRRHSLMSHWSRQSYYPHRYHSHSTNHLSSYCHSCLSCSRTSMAHWPNKREWDPICKAHQSGIEQTWMTHTLSWMRVLVGDLALSGNCWNCCRFIQCLISHAYWSHKQRLLSLSFRQGFNGLQG